MLGNGGTVKEEFLNNKIDKDINNHNKHRCIRMAQNISSATCIAIYSIMLVIEITLIMGAKTALGKHSNYAIFVLAARVIYFFPTIVTAFFIYKEWRKALKAYKMEFDKNNKKSTRRLKIAAVLDVARNVLKLPNRIAVIVITVYAIYYAGGLVHNGVNLGVSDSIIMPGWISKLDLYSHFSLLIETLLVVFYQISYGYKSKKRIVAHGFLLVGSLLYLIGYFQIITSVNNVFNKSCDLHSVAGKTYGVPIGDILLLVGLFLVIIMKIVTAYAERDEKNPEDEQSDKVRDKISNDELDVDNVHFPDKDCVETIYHGLDKNSDSSNDSGLDKNSDSSNDSGFISTIINGRGINMDDGNDDASVVASEVENSKEISCIVDAVDNCGTGLLVEGVLSLESSARQSFKTHKAAGASEWFNKSGEQSGHQH